MTRKRALLLLAALVGGGLGLLSSCSGEEAALGRRPDVILISIDTWRFDHASWVDARLAHTTPRLSSWAARADYAGTALSPVPLTLPAHATMMSGLYPDEHGVRENDAFALPDAAARPFSVLAEDLHAAGYRTGAFVAAQPLDRRFGLDAGFDHYRQPEGGAAPRSHTFREIPGEEVTRHALEWVRKTVRSDEPLFLFAHYFDPHWPYEPPETGPAGRDERYAAEVRRADAAVGDLLEGLGERAEEALVIVVGDHGEALGAHGEGSHGYLVHDSTLRVPCLIKLPGPARPGRLQPGPSPRLVDLHPTVLGVANLAPQREARRSGRDLREPAPEDWAHRGETLYPWTHFRYARLRSYRDAEHKVIEGGGKLELYRWRHDPWEKSDLAPAEPELAARLRSSLLRTLATARQARAADSWTPVQDANPYFGSRSPGQPIEPTEEENRRLRHPREGFGVIDDLDRARQLIGMRRYLDADHLLRRYGAEERDRNPSLLYWTARARHLLGRQGGVRELEEADALFALSEERFHSRHAMDSRLRLRLDLHGKTRDRAHLEEVLELARGRIAAGTETAMAAVYRARAHEGLGQPDAALRAWERAYELDPHDPRIREDLARARAAARR